MPNSNELNQLVLDFEKNQSPAPSDYFTFIQKLDVVVRDIHLDVEAVEYYRPKYPIDQHGYAVAFDPVTQPFDALMHWREFGFVVFKNTVALEDIKSAVEFIENLITTHKLLSKDCITDEDNVPLLSRGFLDIYHHQTLANLRQSLRLYVAYCLLWKTTKLWVSFDRFGLKPPQGESSEGLGLHVDQNPTVHPKFQTIQAVLALSDCPAVRGTFVAVPGSIAKFREYTQFVNPGYAGEFVELKDSYLKEEMTFNQQLIPLRQGHLVAWDSRLTHANSSNISNKNRYVAYISAGVAKNNSNLIEQRKTHYETGLGVNVRDAYMHASKKPRFSSVEFYNELRGTNSENLTFLGRLLYSLEAYEGL